MKFTEEEKINIFNEIITMISGGTSLRESIRVLGSINKDTFFSWIAKDKALADQYTRACEVRADAIFEDIFDISDDGTNDYYEKVGKDGEKFIVLDSENIQRSRLRVEARKWALSKMNPKKYGEKMEVDLKQTPPPQPLKPELIDKIINEL